MPGSDVDLRDLPRYFWLGLGLEVAGGITIVASASLTGEIAGGCVFVTGFALAVTAYLFRRERKRGDAGDAEAAREAKPRKGARTLGALLICAGIFGAAISLRGGGRFEGAAMAMIAIALGVMYFRDTGLPSRQFTATGREGPLALRLGVHVKHFIAMAVCALVVVVGAFARPAADAATVERLWWWGFMGLAAFFTVHSLGSYVWHCWIRRDYVEPRFDHW